MIRQLITPFGKYHHKVMLFGQAGAPSVLQRMTNMLFGDVARFVSAYIDDFVIFSSSWEDHPIHLYQMLERLDKARLAVKQAKC